MAKYLLVGIPALLDALIIPAVLKGMSQNTSTDSTQNFVMRCSKGVGVIGILAVALFGVCLYFSIASNQATTGLLFLFGALFLVGFFLLALPSKGFYECIVDGDILTVRRFWSSTRSISIKEIRQCMIVNGGIKVYINGKDKPVINIESIFKNSKNFIRRMQEENIPVINNTTGFWNEQR